MKNEFYDIAFRKKIYSSLEELQIDVNEWLKQYNELRPHSGKYCYGALLYLACRHIYIKKLSGFGPHISFGLQQGL